MSKKLVLILNCGSSSLKFAVIDPISGKNYLSGLAECLGLEDARIKWQIEDSKEKSNLAPRDKHFQALQFVLKNILQHHQDIEKNIVAVGHRVAHGGENFTESVLIDAAVLKEIDACSSLAPLHNPAQVVGIKSAQQAFANLPNTAVFDTAYHQTMPREAYLYALPYELYEKHSIRRYGFHGTSHYYIATEIAKKLNKPLNQVNMINCHLGNGASICAIKNGQSIDTSMGLTPLAGLVMGTRCGDIDPSIIFHLHDKLGYEYVDIEEMLSKKSGLLGLTGESSDCRYIEDNYQTKDEAKRALEVFVHRIVHFIGAYAMQLDGRIDALVFTGGIGENDSHVRALVIEKLAILNYHLDKSANEKARFGNQGVITTADSKLAMVIATNEELVIAQDTLRLIS